MYLIGLFLITYAIVFHSIRTSQYNIRGSVVAFMILCGLFSPLKVNVFGQYETNVSTIWYSAAIACQTFLAMEFGFKFSLKNAVLTVKWMIFIQISISLMSALPDLKQISDLPLIIYLLSLNTVRGLFSSYTAFVIASGALAMVAARMTKFYRPFTFLVATIVAQFVSSITFYPIAFMYDPGMSNVMVSGFLSKMIMSTLYFPLIYFMHHERLKPDERH